jgi:Ca-activated chloride channel family protein
MVRYMSVCALVLAGVGGAHGHGLLIPVEKQVPPLAMLNHQVNITVEDQVATTHVEQTFRNHTSRALEATYVFPVPKGASVKKFTMWVNGSEVAGELVEADKARQTYTDIVRRTQDPGLLEYMGNNLLRLRVFPIAPNADQKVALEFTAVAPRDGSLVEYVYPLKTDGKATRTLEKFSLQATIKSQHPIQNVYSPTHAISLSRSTDREVGVRFDKDQALLDKDFLLYYAVGDQEVGLTTLTQRPISSEPGFAMLLLSPRVEMSKSQVIPRDMVMVLDTSGSMRGVKMDQAKKALKYCLSNLGAQDRFALINFATTVNKYREGLVDATSEQLEQGNKWVDRLEATGGTAIDDALKSALDLRTSDSSRSFSIVFFTDGCPTVGETDPQKILKNVAAKNTANTRIFTFGVGDDVNATMLDQLAEDTRALSTYVRPAEDIEVKVSSLYSKISHPVLANVKVTVGPNVSLQEVYPPQLPDLFAGGQVVVLARYAGNGPAAIKLTGAVGKETREFVYEMTFPDKTTQDKAFVEHLWARRKVGYLLDQIRANGEKKELVEETVALAKKYGIATPYTSYLIVPDAPMPVVKTPANGAAGKPNVRFNVYNHGWGAGGAGGAPGPVPAGLVPGTAAPTSAAAQLKVLEFAKQNQVKMGDLGRARGGFEDEKLKRLPADDRKGDPKDGKGEADKDALTVLRAAKEQKASYDQARRELAQRRLDAVQTGTLGVNLSVQGNNLRSQSRLTLTALRNAGGRNCLELGGVWIDEGFDAKMPTLTVKAMSDAYFRILERHPQVKEAFQLGNHLVWVTPNGTALVIDTTDGKEKLTDAEIDQLFVAKAK